MLVSTASKLTLLTKEHFLSRDLKNVPAIKASLVYYTDRNTAELAFRN